MHLVSRPIRLNLLQTILLEISKLGLEWKFRIDDREVIKTVLGVVRVDLVYQIRLRRIS